jgi:RNA polymerase sigma-70 factor (ECF subfamily)
MSRPRGRYDAIHADASAERDVRDGRWVASAARGDQEAFRNLVEHYKDRVYRVARGILGDREEALDVAQETFLRVYRSLHRFRKGGSFYTWLYRIAVNLSIDARRRLPRHGRVSLESVRSIARVDHPPSAALDRAERKRQVEAVLARLPCKYRIILLLRDVEGFKSTEIARIIGCTHSTARWYLHRARRAFRAMWDGDPVSRHDQDPAPNRGRTGDRACALGLDT